MSSGQQKRCPQDSRIPCPEDTAGQQTLRPQGSRTVSDGVVCSGGVPEHHLNTQDWMNRIVLAHNRLLFTDTDILFDAWQIKDDF